MKIFSEKLRQTFKGHPLQARSAVVLLSVVALLVVGFGIWYPARGWIRNTLAPEYICQSYCAELNQTLSNQDETFGHPLRLLGVQRIHNIPASCELDEASYFDTSVRCGAGYNGTSRLVDRAELATINDNVHRLHQMFKSNGWYGGYWNGHAPSVLASPPATIELPIGHYSYSKTINGIECMLQFDGGFSAGPTDTIISASFICSRGGYFL